MRCEVLLQYKHNREMFSNNTHFLNLTMLYVIHRKFIFKIFAVISGQNSTKNAFPVSFGRRICMY